MANAEETRRDYREGVHHLIPMVGEAAINDLRLLLQGEAGEA
jgi:hypothetical protein